MAEEENVAGSYGCGGGSGDDVQKIQNIACCGSPVEKRKRLSFTNFSLIDTNTIVVSCELDLSIKQYIIAVPDTKGYARRLYDTCLDQT